MATRFSHSLASVADQITRHRRWRRKGVWERAFKPLAEAADNEYAMVDSTIVRAHQHSAGAKGGIVKARVSGAPKAG